MCNRGTVLERRKAAGDFNQFYSLSIIKRAWSNDNFEQEYINATTSYMLI